MRPLKFPRGGVPAPGIAERLLWWLPVIGWTGAAEIARERLRPIRRYVEGQIARRGEGVESAWGSDERRRSLALQMCRLIREAYAWPNDRFIPDDPIEVLCVDDDGELSDIVAQLLGQIGVPEDLITDVGFHRLWQMNLGGAVDWLLAMPHTF